MGRQEALKNGEDPGPPEQRNSQASRVSRSSSSSSTPVEDETKAEEEKIRNERCFIIYEGSVACTRVSLAFCIVDGRFFCFDIRCRVPPGEDLPCMLTCLPFCMLCAEYEWNIGCMEEVSDYIPRFRSMSKIESVGSPVQVRMKNASSRE